MRGNVKFFNNAAGWGIIEGNNGKIFFIHHRDIMDERFFPKDKPQKFRTLKDGQSVEFSVSLEDTLQATHNETYAPAKNLKILT